MIRAYQQIVCEEMNYVTTLSHHRVLPAIGAWWKFPVL